MEQELELQCFLYNAYYCSRESKSNDLPDWSTGGEITPLAYFMKL